jgi:hypothetical protein
MGAEVVALVIIRSAKSRRGCEVSEPAQRIGALLHTTMVLLDQIIEVLVRAVLYLASRHFADGA